MGHGQPPVSQRPVPAADDKTKPTIDNPIDLRGPLSKPVRTLLARVLAAGDLLIESDNAYKDFVAAKHKNPHAPEAFEAAKKALSKNQTATIKYQVFTEAAIKTLTPLSAALSQRLNTRAPAFKRFMEQATPPAKAPPPKNDKNPPEKNPSQKNPPEKNPPEKISLEAQFWELQAFYRAHTLFGRSTPTSNPPTQSKGV